MQRFDICWDSYWILWYLNRQRRVVQNKVHLFLLNRLTSQPTGVSLVLVNATNHRTGANTMTNQATLIDFATQAAQDELLYSDYTDADTGEMVLNTMPCAGIWQSFCELFEDRTSSDWTLVATVFASTVKVLAAQAGLETIED
jgi:hypothetical protein